jgi:hypothetical protein
VLTFRPRMVRQPDLGQSTLVAMAIFHDDGSYL